MNGRKVTSRTLTVSESDYEKFLAQKRDERRALAKEYKENSEVTVKDLMLKYGVSRNTANRGLREAGIEIEKERNKVSQKGHSYFQVKCPHCAKVIRHYCEEASEAQEMGSSSLAKAQVDLKLQDGPAQVLDHVPLRDEDWAFSDDRLRQMMSDGMDYDQIIELLAGNQTPFPKNPRAKEVATSHLRYILQFQGVAPENYPKGIPPSQLLDVEP